MAAIDASSPPAASDEIWAAIFFFFLFFWPIGASHRPVSRRNRCVCLEVIPSISDILFRGEDHRALEDNPLRALPASSSSLGGLSNLGNKEEDRLTAETAFLGNICFKQYRMVDAD